MRSVCIAALAATAWAAAHHPAHPPHDHYSSSADGNSSSSSSSSSTSTSVEERRAERARALRFNAIVADNLDSRSTFWLAVTGLAGPPPARSVSVEKRTIVAPPRPSEYSLRFLAQVDADTGAVATQPGSHQFLRGAGTEFTNGLNVTSARTMACRTRDPIVIGKRQYYDEGGDPFETMTWVAATIDADGDVKSVDKLLEDEGNAIVGAAMDIDKNVLWAFLTNDVAGARTGLVRFDWIEGQWVPSFLGGYEAPFGVSTERRDNSLAISESGFLWHSHGKTLRILSTVNGHRSAEGVDLVYPSWQHVECAQPDGAVCGNGVCEYGPWFSATQENSVNCPADCASKTYGTRQFCCGSPDGVAESDDCYDKFVPCSDERCTPVGPRPGDTLRCEYIVDSRPGRNEDVLHDFRPTVFDMEFEPEFGRLYAVIATVGNPLHFQCFDEGLYKWFASIDTTTGVVSIVAPVPEGTGAFTICQNRDGFAAAVAKDVADNSLDSAASSSDTSDFVEFVDGLVKERLASRSDCFADFRFPSQTTTSTGTFNSDSGDLTTFVNLVSDRAGAVAGVDEMALTQDTWSATEEDASAASDLSHDNKEVLQAAVAVIKKHFDWFVFETEGGASVENDCPAVRAAIEAALGIRDSRDSLFKPSDLVIIARTLTSEDPIFAKGGVFQSPTGPGRVEFILKPCSRSSKARSLALAQVCSSILECGDQERRIEWNDGSLGTDSHYDCNSCPIPVPATPGVGHDFLADLSACIVSGGSNHCLESFIRFNNEAARDAECKP